MKILLVSPYKSHATGRGDRKMLLEAELKARGHKMICLRNGFCIRAIILLALYKRLHVSSWYKPNLMAMALRKSAPVMRGGTSLHCHNAGRVVSK